MNSCESGKFKKFNFDDELVKDTCVIKILNRKVMENIDPIINLIMIFILACIIGYYVIWGATLGTSLPLMAVTNAISSVIIVGAIIAAGPDELNFSSIMGFLAIILASSKYFWWLCSFTQEILSMFKKKEIKKEK